MDKLEIVKVKHGIKKVRLKLENKLEFIKGRLRLKYGRALKTKARKGI